MTYVCLWILFCLIAAGILIKDRKRISPELAVYRRFLCVPWKLAIFAPAFLFVTFAGHFTDDETWDVISGSGMSLLTFLTAPWAIGLVYQVAKKQRPLRYIIVAIALCLFSSSWFYDGYLFIRDGEYTSRWVGNLLLSPIIYISAGLLWNLQAKAGGGFTFSFLRTHWPRPPINQSFRSIFLIAIPLILVAAFVLIAYVGWHF